MVRSLLYYKQRENKENLENKVFVLINIKVCRRIYKMNVLVKEFVGASFTKEDAIVLREFIRDNLDKKVQLDFSDIDRVPTTFFWCLLTDLFNENGREYVLDKINVKNLSNQRDFRRVTMGTAF